MANNWPVWRAALYPDRLRLHPPDGSLPFDVHRPEWESRAELTDAMLLPRALSLKLDKKRLFRLDAGAFRAVSDWVGQPQLLRGALKRRLGWMLPVGAIFVLGSLPFGCEVGDPARKPFEPAWLAFGLLIAVIWFLWKVRPHPLLFLLDSAWLLALAVTTAIKLSHGWRWFWFALLLLQLSLALSGLRLYGRFRNTRLTDEPPATGTP